MSVMAFMLFVGFGLGSYLFGLALQLSLTDASIIFSAFELILSAIAFQVFKKETFIKTVVKKIHLIES